MPEPRIAAHTDEACQEKDGRFFLQLITENEPGFNPSWWMFDTLAAARADAQEFNETRGLTPEDVLAIRISSMNAGKVNR